MAYTSEQRAEVFQAFDEALEELHRHGRAPDHWEEGLLFRALGEMWDDKFMAARTHIEDAQLKPMARPPDKGHLVYENRRLTFTKEMLRSGIARVREYFATKV